MCQERFVTEGGLVLLCTHHEKSRFVGGGSNKNVALMLRKNKRDAQPTGKTNLKKRKGNI